MNFRHRLKKRIKLHYYTYPSHFTHTIRNYRTTKLNKFNISVCFSITMEGTSRHYVTNQITPQSYFETIIGSIFDINWRLNVSCAKVVYHNNSFIFSNGFLGGYSSFTSTIIRPSYFMNGRQFYKDNYTPYKLMCILKETK